MFDFSSILHVKNSFSYFKPKTKSGEVILCNKICSH